MGLFQKLFGKSEIINTDESASISLGGKTITFDNALRERLAIENLAMAAYDAKQYSTAISHYDRVISSAPQEAMYYTRRGTVYEDMGDDNKAKVDFEKALQLNPDDYIAQFRLGMLYQRRKDLNNAVVWLRKSYRNQSSYSSLLGNVYNNLIFVHKRVIAYNLGNFLIQLGRVDEGMQYIDEVIKNCPDYSYPFYVKGLTFASDGKYSVAAGYLKKASDLGHPTAPQVLSQIRVMLSSTGARTSSANILDATGSDDPRLSDRYSQMVEATSFNPFKITTNVRANQGLRFGNLIDVFKRELEELLSHGIPVDTVLCGYSFKMIESYYKNGGYVPKIMMDEILSQIFKAAQKTSAGNILTESYYEKFRYKMYHDLTHN